MRTLLTTTLLALVLAAGGCASSAGGGNANATAFDATGGGAAAEAAARSVLEANGVVIDEQVASMMKMFGMGGTGPVQMVAGRSPGGSDVTASIAQAGTAGEVTVTILVEDPDDPVLQAAIARDLQAALPAPAAGKL